LIIPTDERRTAFLLSILNYGGTTIGRKDFEEVMGHKVKFAYPKPVVLLKKLIATATRDGDIVLDSFAGSGTTAQAVLEVNRDDSGTRKFILIEMEDDIAEKITAERVKRAIKKYVYKDGFEYCELDKPLFNEHGQIEETCDFKQFATYIYFTETQTNIDSAKIKGNYIGEQGNMEYYLIYKEPHKNDLDKPFLKKVEKTGAKKIVYADRCMLDESELAEYNLVFKQIPYEVKIY
jgi:adenine-specific DNA-methyltransferase